ncbi:MAG TPA: zinc ribbon domain-containing protein [Anaerolineae bacterium]|nr:zinc ribbon domain-containing protein [Anaerolineae bacterium]
MPIYEYRCQSCQTRFELRRSFSQADDPVTCPQCQSGEVQRLISSFIALSSGSEGTTALGGSACSTCAATSCAACNLARK